MRVSSSIEMKMNPLALHGLCRATLQPTLASGSEEQGFLAT